MPQTAPIQPVQPQQLDPQVVALAKAIRQTESGGNFNAKGKSGEVGAYQFTEPTWQKLKAKYNLQSDFGNLSQEDQNKAAYNQIQEWKNKGFNVGQVASSWNAGEGEPDAYTGKFSNGKPSVGVNKYGVKYDVPAYAKSVAGAYQTLKQGGQVQADPMNPSSTANPSQPVPTQDEFGKNHPILSGISKFATAIEEPFIGLAAAPVQGIAKLLGQPDPYAEGIPTAVGKANVSKLGLEEKAGDALQVGSYLIPEAKGASLTKGVFTGLKTGAKIGAAQGAGAQMSSGGSLQDVGIGALTGGALGAAAGGVGGVIGGHTPSGAVKSITNKYQSVFNSTAPLRKAFEEADAKGNNLAEFLSSKATGKEGAVLSVDGDGKIGVGNLPERIEKDLQPLYDARAELLKQSGEVGSLSEWEQQALKMADTTENRASGALQDTQDEISKIAARVRKNYGGKDLVPLDALQEIKIAQAKTSKVFDATKPNFSKNANYLLSNAARKMIEEKTPKMAGSSMIHELNALIGKHLDAEQFLEKLGKSSPRVKGGRLGKYFATTLGSMAANAAGGGFLGTLAGGAGGNYLMELLMSNTISSPLKEILLKRAVEKDPAILKQIQKFLGTQAAERLARPKLPEGRKGIINEGKPIITPHTSYEPQAKQIGQGLLPQQKLLPQKASPMITPVSSNPR